MKKQKGFTLIEMIIYMGIFSILIVILMNFFTSILDVKLESEATSSVTQDGRYIIARLSYDIARASSVESPTLGNSSSSLQIKIDGVPYTYSLDASSNLQVTNPSSYQLNSSDTTINPLTFKTIGNTGGKPAVQINLTVNSRILRRSGNQTEKFQTIVGTR